MLSNTSFVVDILHQSCIKQPGESGRFLFRGVLSGQDAEVPEIKLLIYEHIKSLL